MHVPSFEQEVEQLVVEQIRKFKKTERMSDSDIVEYHLRHYRILFLYRERERMATTKDDPDNILLA
jgi:hypothetical protein